MNRNITGTIRKTDGAVWAGAVVEFELERSSYDDTAQYPMRAERAVADENGELQLSLWVNEEALRPSRYICTLPDGSQFRFTLPEGSGAVDLNELRENAIEEDSPTQSTMVAFLPIVRSEAQQVVDQSLVAVNAEIDTKADQSALDATNTTVGQLVDGVETLSGLVDEKASQADLDTTNAHLAALDTEVDTKANQSALNTTNANVATLISGLAAANTAIATKASQSALDATNVNLAALDAEVDTKAEQLALDATNANVSDLTDGLFSANASILSLSNGLTDANSAIATKANQSALNTTNANVTTVTNGLAAANTAIATKASQADLNLLTIEVETKAKQISLDATDADVAQLVSDLDTLQHEVDDKASQADLNSTNINLAALDAAILTKASQADLNTANAAIATKANQSSLNTTNANVTALTDGLATANAEIAIRARQTALNTTNSNVTALSAVVDTKASEFALNTAITNLEDAISAAQSALEDLIDQKANLVHTHEPGDITTNSLNNSIGYFDSDGVFTGSGEFVFAQGLLGLGTGDPEYTVDLRHSGGMIGSNSRITAALDSGGAHLRLWSDPNIPQASTIDLEANGYVNTIDSDVEGSLGLGQEGSTPNLHFRLLDSTTAYRGLKVGFTDPTETEFPPNSFGFYLLQELMSLDSTLFLVFHDGNELKRVTLK